jgi:hypothetical protein
MDQSFPEGPAHVFFVALHQGQRGIRRSRLDQQGVEKIGMVGEEFIKRSRVFKPGHGLAHLALRQRQAGLEPAQVGLVVARLRRGVLLGEVAVVPLFGLLQRHSGGFVAAIGQCCIEVVAPFVQIAAGGQLAQPLQRGIKLAGHQFDFGDLVFDGAPVVKGYFGLQMLGNRLGRAIAFQHKVEPDQGVRRFEQQT